MQEVASSSLATSISQNDLIWLANGRPGDAQPGPLADVHVGGGMVAGPKRAS